MSKGPFDHHVLRWLIAALAAGAVGCRSRVEDPCARVAGTCLAIRVEPAATPTRVDQLALSVMGDGVEAHQLVGDGEPLELPATVGVELGALAHSPVSVTVMVDAISELQVDGFGSGGVDVSDGEHQTVTIAVDGGVADLGDGGLGDADLGDAGLGTADGDAAAGDLADAGAAPPDLGPPPTCADNEVLCTAADGTRACTDVATDPTSCGACGLACGPGSGCGDGACITSYAYPTNDAGGFTAARGFALTIQSLAPATIYYTTDGSTPTMSSPNGASPLVLGIGASAVVKWFTSSDPIVHTHEVVINTALQKQIGQLADQVRFDKSHGPIVFASPGEVLGGLINEQVWGGQGYCPTCVRVYGIGVQAVEQCLGAEVPPNWPGTTWNNFRFAVHAPKEPGLYHLRRGINLDYQCYPGTAVGGDDGLVVVQ